MTQTLTPQGLVGHMQEQLVSLQRMQAILEQQEKAVLDKDTEQVLRSVAQIHQELTIRVGLETSREEMILEWAAGLGCQPEQITVSRLASQYPEYGAQLQDLSNQLHDLAVQVQAKQEYCRALLRSELQFISHLVDAMYPGQNTGAYRPGSQIPQTTLTSALDIKG